MSDKNLPDYIVKNVVSSAQGDNYSLRTFHEAFVHRKLTLTTIENVHPANLRKLLAFIPKDNWQAHFEFAKIKLTSGDYFNYLEQIMLTSYDLNDEDYLDFFAKLSRESKDFYTKDITKAILRFIENKTYAKLGNALDISRISSLRKVDLVEAFYTFPIYSPENKIKIAKQMYMKGHLTDEKYGSYSDSLSEMFLNPLFQTYFALSVLLGKETDITEALSAFCLSYDKLGKDEQASVDGLINLRDLKTFIKEKVDAKNLKNFEAAWTSLITEKLKSESMLLSFQKEKEKALETFIGKYSTGHSFMSLINKTIKITSDTFESYAFHKQEGETILTTETITLTPQKSKLEDTIQPIRELFDAKFPTDVLPETVKKSLDFISDLKITLTDVENVRNSIENSDLLDKAIYIKIGTREFPSELVLDYASAVPYETLKEMDFLFKSAERIIWAIDFNNKKHLTTLKKIMSLLTQYSLVSPEKAIIKRYEEIYPEDFSLLFTASGAEDKFIELITTT